MGGDGAESKKEVGFRVWADSSPFPWAAVSSLSGGKCRAVLQSVLHTETPLCETCALFFTATQASDLFREPQVLQSTEDLFLCTAAPKLPNPRDLLTGGRIASLI